MTEMTQIKSSIISRLVAVLPVDYKALAYLEDVEQNNWNQIEKGYGVRPLAASEVSGVNKVYTITQPYEVVLTGQYIQAQVGDEELRGKADELKEECLGIYKDMINTKAGLPAVVMNISALFIDEPEIDIEAKVVVQRMEFVVLYRISLI